MSRFKRDITDHHAPCSGGRDLSLEPYFKIDRLVIDEKSAYLLTKIFGIPESNARDFAGWATYKGTPIVFEKVIIEEDYQIVVSLLEEMDLASPYIYCAPQRQFFDNIGTVLWEYMNNIKDDLNFGPC